jgi:hypothetical protein
MTVRFFGTQRHNQFDQGFLRQFRVSRLVGVDENRKSYTPRRADPALEVDGKLFVDPNVDALKKIFTSRTPRSLAATQP